MNQRLPVGAIQVSESIRTMLTMLFCAVWIVQIATIMQQPYCEDIDSYSWCFFVNLLAGHLLHPQRCWLDEQPFSQGLIGNMVIW